MGRKKSYQQELLEWRWEQLRLRRKYADTPAGFLDKETERKAISQWKEDVRAFRANNIHALTSAEIFSEEPFAGREAELLQIRENLEKSTGPIVLYGIGGIGKSALAREYIRRYRDTYDHVLSLTFQTTVQNLIADDFHVQISNLQYVPGQYKSKRKYFLKKVQILREIADKEKLLLVIDDCNTGQDRDMPELFSLPCHIILTSRRNPSIWGLCQGIHVEELKSEEDWTAFVKCYQTKEYLPEDRKAFDDYRKKVQSHTLMMQQKLRNPTGDFNGLAEFQKGLFQRIPLKKEEKLALAYLSVMPVQGIPRKLFLMISKTTEQTVKKLSDYLLVQRAFSGNWQDELLFLHPLIAEAARKIFRPSTDNCGQIIQGLGDYLNGNGNDADCTWSRTYQENQRLEPYVFAFVEAFPKPAPWLAEAFDELVTFLWIQGYYQDAERYSKALYHQVLSYYGENHQITG